MRTLRYQGLPLVDYLAVDYVRPGGPPRPYRAPADQRGEVCYVLPMCSREWGWAADAALPPEPCLWPVRVAGPSRLPLPSAARMFLLRSRRLFGPTADSALRSDAMCASLEAELPCSTGEENVTPEVRWHTYSRQMGAPVMRPCVRGARSAAPYRL